MDILVVVEHLKGEIADITYEMLGKARELADASGGSVTAALIGSDMGAATASLGAANRVLHVDHSALAEFNPTTYAAAVSQLIREGFPRADPDREHVDGHGPRRRGLGALQPAAGGLRARRHPRRRHRAGHQPALRREDLRRVGHRGRSRHRQRPGRRLPHRGRQAGRLPGGERGAAAGCAGGQPAALHRADRARGRRRRHHPARGPGGRRTRRAERGEPAPDRDPGEGSGRRRLLLASHRRQQVAAQDTSGGASRASRSSPSCTWRWASAVPPSTSRG